MSSAQLNNAVVSSPVFATARDVRRSREQFEMAVSLLERIADLAAVMAAALSTYSAYAFLEVGKQLHYSTGTVLTVCFVFALAFVVILDRDGAYEKANSLLRIRETERILRVSMHAFAMVFPITFFFSFLFSRWVVVLAVVTVPLLLVIEKQFMFFM